MGSHAMYWYKLAAAKNSAKAENNIGMLYNFAKGVQLDYSLAMGWYIKAARKYNQDAFANIAKLLEMGFGLSENKYMALEWYSKYHSASFHIRRLEDQGFYLAIKDKGNFKKNLIKCLATHIYFLL
jgi:TPR repeat protein